MQHSWAHSLGTGKIEWEKYPFYLYLFSLKKSCRNYIHYIAVIPMMLVPATQAVNPQSTSTLIHRNSLWR